MYELYLISYETQRTVRSHWRQGLGHQEIEITGAAGINEAKHGDITFLADKKLLNDILNTKASAVIANEEIEGLSSSILVSDNPYFTFARRWKFFTKTF